MGTIFLDDLEEGDVFLYKGRKYRIDEIDDDGDYHCNEIESDNLDEFSNLIIDDRFTLVEKSSALISITKLIKGDTFTQRGRRYVIKEIDEDGYHCIQIERDDSDQYIEIILDESDFVEE